MPKNYRKIYEQYYNTSIPKGYHIHHIDGNPNNNDIENLICVSPQAHFNIHLMQGDPVCVNGKFIQGASAAGKKGGSVSGYKITDDGISNIRKAIIRGYNNGTRPSPKGRKSSDETKKKISNATKGKNNPMYGRTHTKETKERISKKIIPLVQGKDNPFYGRTHTKETKQKFRELKLGKNNPMFGRTHTKETKQKIKNKNHKWYNNGLEECKYTEHQQPEGYVKGRLYKWYTDGNVTIRAKEHQQPEGFTRGRSKLCKRKS